MYGIFTYIYHKKQPNVGEYTIHGSYGYAFTKTCYQVFQTPGATHGWLDPIEVAIPIRLAAQQWLGSAFCTYSALG